MQVGRMSLSYLERLGLVPLGRPPRRDLHAPAELVQQPIQPGQL